MSKPVLRAVTPSYRRDKRTESVKFSVENLDVKPVEFPEYVYREWIAWLSKKHNVSEKDAALMIRESKNTAPHPSGYLQDGPSSLFAAAQLAFKNHYPLALRPDDIWLCILFGVVSHVSLFPEECRDVFVSHEGMKDLVIETSVEHDWENEVFPAFIEKIKENGKDEKMFNAFAYPFTTSTATDVSCRQIALMAAVAPYHHFRDHTMCGIPYVRMYGTLEDWKSIKTKTEYVLDALESPRMTAWKEILLPILDKIAESFEGKIDHLFWQSIYKIFVEESGYSDVISGWIACLFPYLCSGFNEKLKQWDDYLEEEKVGPAPEDFPKVMMTVPVTWNHLGMIREIEYHAGFAGMCASTMGEVEMVSGWMVTEI